MDAVVPASIKGVGRRVRLGEKQRQKKLVCNRETEAQRLSHPGINIPLPGLRDERAGMLQDTRLVNIMDKLINR